MPPVLSFAKDLHYDTLITASAVVFPLSRMSIVRPSNINSGLVSPSSRSSSQTSHVYAFSTWRMKEAVRSRSFLHCRGCWPSSREQDRGTPPFVLSFVERINITSPPTYVEPYLGDTTRRRRDGLGSSASSYHEITAIANGSYQCYFFPCTPRVIGKKPSSASSKPSGRLGSLPSYIPLYTN